MRLRALDTQDARGLFLNIIVESIHGKIRCPLGGNSESGSGPYAV
jgi:hypothetical protein